MNAMTFDVEEWFHAANLGIPPERWSIPRSRLDQPLEAILTLLGHEGIQGTFFILGWVASRRPELVRRIHEEGHEVASHGYLHRPLRGQSRSAFARDVGRSKAVLEDLTGGPVVGYRAPGYSVGRETGWALDVPPGGLVAGLLTGLIVSLGSALIPAIRAARISPIEALGAGGDPSRRARAGWLVRHGWKVGLTLMAATALISRLTVPDEAMQIGLSQMNFLLLIAGITLLATLGQIRYHSYEDLRDESGMV